MKEFKLKRYLAVFIALIITACVPDTKQVKFDLNDAEAMPHEMAVDAVTSFTKMNMTVKESKCIFQDEGVRHKAGGDLVPYEQVYFNAKNVAYSTVDYHPHIFMYNQTDGSDICDSFLNNAMLGQEDFERMFQWFGTALISLGAKYVEPAE